MASLVEVAAGAALVLGLLTPIAAAGVVGVMLVACITNHMRNGFFIFRPGEGCEYVMVADRSWAWPSGPSGPASGASTGTSSALQHLWGWPGFGIAVGAGGLGAAGLLGGLLAPGEAGRSGQPGLSRAAAVSPSCGPAGSRRPAWPAGTRR